MCLLSLVLWVAVGFVVGSFAVGSDVGCWFVVVVVWHWCLMVVGVVLLMWIVWFGLVGN